MDNTDMILNRLLVELETALETDRGPAVPFKDQVCRALDRARRASLEPGGAGRALRQIPEELMAAHHSSPELEGLFGGAHARGKKYLA